MKSNRRQGSSSQRGSSRSRRQTRPHAISADKRELHAALQTPLPVTSAADEIASMRNRLRTVSAMHEDAIRQLNDRANVELAVRHFQTQVTKIEEVAQRLVEIGSDLQRALMVTRPSLREEPE